MEYDETAPCQWCEAPTSNVGSLMCDACRTVFQHIRGAKPGVVIKMLGLLQGSTVPQQAALALLRDALALLEPPLPEGWALTGVVVGKRGALQLIDPAHGSVVIKAAEVEDVVFNLLAAAAKEG